MLKVISSFCRMCLLCSVHQTLSSETSCVQCLSHKFSRRLIIVVFFGCICLSLEWSIHRVGVLPENLAAVDFGCVIGRYKYASLIWMPGCMWYLLSQSLAFYMCFHITIIFLAWFLAIFCFINFTWKVMLCICFSMASDSLVS